MEPLAWYRVAAPVVLVLSIAGVCLWRPLPLCQALLLGIVPNVGYAIIQDQFSARLCPEYFTVFHNPIPGLTDPTLLAIAWGFLGTWWGGAFIGILAWSFATLGTDPPLTFRQLIRPMLLVTGTIALSVIVSGFAVWRHVELFGVELSPEVAGMIPPERRKWLLIVGCYHFAGYITAGLSGTVLCIWIAHTRKTMRIARDSVSSTSAG